MSDLIVFKIYSLWMALVSFLDMRYNITPSKNHQFLWSSFRKAVCDIMKMLFSWFIQLLPVLSKIMTTKMVLWHSLRMIIILKILFRTELFQYHILQKMLILQIQVWCSKLTIPIINIIFQQNLQPRSLNTFFLISRFFDLAFLRSSN